jgi:hypothetical protein
MAFLPKDVSPIHFDLELEEFEALRFIIAEKSQAENIRELLKSKGIWKNVFILQLPDDDLHVSVGLEISILFCRKYKFSFKWDIDQCHQVIREWNKEIISQSNPCTEAQTFMGIQKIVHDMEFETREKLKSEIGKNNTDIIFKSGMDSMEAHQFVESVREGKINTLSEIANFISRIQNDHIKHSLEKIMEPCTCNLGLLMLIQCNFQIKEIIAHYPNLFQVMKGWDKRTVKRKIHIPYFKED